MACGPLWPTNDIIYLHNILHILVLWTLSTHTLSALTQHQWLPPALAFGCSFRCDCCLVVVSPALHHLLLLCFWCLFLVCASGVSILSSCPFSLLFEGILHFATRMPLWPCFVSDADHLLTLGSVLWASPHIHRVSVVGEAMTLSFPEMASDWQVVPSATTTILWTDHFLWHIAGPPTALERCVGNVLQVVCNNIVVSSGFLG